ncbi:MAG: NAD(P)-dependent alcohol dehydrogenase [Deltaproteobacteria bacterium]|nr:NAD(P)-dependent alcohol dehydrogenase [Deltaproteobacteria bacterium]
MKAIVYQKYGSPDVLELQEIEKPAATEGEVLVRVHAASVNPYDWHFLRGTPLVVRVMAGLLKPKRKILGLDVAGRVEAVGGRVTQFQPGDEIFGISPNAFAEYLCVSENGVVLKPANLTYEEAAAVPVAALTALQCLRDKGQIQAGHKVLINGASGGVGTFAVQIAKSFGAEVTGVCSTRNLDMVRSIGADHTIDYSQEDFTETGARYDLILDAVGNHSLSDYGRMLHPKGIYVAAAGAPIRALWIAMRKKMSTMLTKPNREDVGFMKELLETGKVTPVIDRRYPLSEVAEALRYLEEGHAQGKVVITV